MAEAMRILQVLEPSGGGSGRHFVDLCAGLQARGHAVTAVYSPLRAERRFVDELQAAGLGRVIPVAMRRAVGPWDLSAWRQLNAVMRHHGPFDIVHGHSSKAGALTRLRPPGPHVPRVYTPHAFRTMDPTLSARGKALYGGIERMLGRFLTDRLICVSEDELAHAETLGIPRDRLRLVVNGVATPSASTRAAVRQRFGFTDQTLVFGFIGRLSPQKAPERLVAAFARVSPSLPQARLLMVGAGELEAEIRSQIQSSGLSERIHLISDIGGAEAVAAFDALVMPSRYEAMSYVMLEAAAAGKPLVLTDVGGAGTVLEHGVNGLLVPNQDDPEPLSAALAALATPGTLVRMAANATARAGRYGLDAMIEQTLGVYRELTRR